MFCCLQPPALEGRMPLELGGDPRTLHMLVQRALGSLQRTTTSALVWLECVTADRSEFIVTSYNIKKLEYLNYDIWDAWTLFI